MATPLISNSNLGKTKQEANVGQTMTIQFHSHKKIKIHLAPWNERNQVEMQCIYICIYNKVMSE